MASILGPSPSSSSSSSATQLATNCTNPLYSFSPNATVQEQHMFDLLRNKLSVILGGNAQLDNFQVDHFAGMQQNLAVQLMQSFYTCANTTVISLAVTMLAVLTTFAFFFLMLAAVFASDCFWRRAGEKKGEKKERKATKERPAAKFSNVELELKREERKTLAESVEEGEKGGANTKDDLVSPPSSPTPLRDESAQPLPTLDFDISLRVALFALSLCGMSEDTCPLRLSHSHSPRRRRKYWMDNARSIMLITMLGALSLYSTYLTAVYESESAFSNQAQLISLIYLAKDMRAFCEGAGASLPPSSLCQQASDYNATVRVNATQSAWPAFNVTSLFGPVPSLPLSVLEAGPPSRCVYSTFGPALIECVMAKAKNDILPLFGSLVIPNVWTTLSAVGGYLVYRTPLLFEIQEVAKRRVHGKVKRKMIAIVISVGVTLILLTSADIFFSFVTTLSDFYSNEVPMPPSSLFQPNGTRFSPLSSSASTFSKVIEISNMYIFLPTIISYTIPPCICTVFLYVCGVLIVYMRSIRATLSTSPFDHSFDEVRGMQAIAAKTARRFSVFIGSSALSAVLATATALLIATETMGLAQTEEANAVWIEVLFSILLVLLASAPLIGCAVVCEEHYRLEKEARRLVDEYETLAASHAGSGEEEATGRVVASRNECLHMYAYLTSAGPPFTVAGLTMDKKLIIRFVSIAVTVTLFLLRNNSRISSFL